MEKEKYGFTDVTERLLPLAPQNHSNRFKEDIEIQRKRPALNIKDVIFKFVLRIQVVGALNLS